MSQFDFSGVDNFLKANQKALGNSLVVMVYKDGKVVYKKEMGRLCNVRPRPQSPPAANG